MEQVQRACAAVGAYLLFVPDDADMMYNKQYYTTTHAQLSDDAFTPEPVSVYGVRMCANTSQSAVEFARTFNIEAQQLINYNTMMRQDEDGMVRVARVDHA